MSFESVSDDDLRSTVQYLDDAQDESGERPGWAERVGAELAGRLNRRLRAERAGRAIRLIALRAWRWIYSTLR